MYISEKFVMWKYFIKEYLSFTKKERTGIFILLFIILICIILPFFFPYFIQQKKYDHSQFDKEIAKLKILQADTSNRNYYNKFDENNYANYNEPNYKNDYTKLKGELFYFDPNTASVDDWKRLGIRDKTAQTIQKYINKGGHFYKPEDIGKIWGLHKGDVDRLLPFVRIEILKNKYTRNDTVDFKKNLDSYKYKKPAVQNVEINSSDTTAFIALPGIGSKLAQRIIAFRQKLGGFYSVDQIKETYGLPDSTFQKIKINLSLNIAGIKKFNINTATLEEMKTHPYIRYAIQTP